METPGIGDAKNVEFLLRKAAGNKWRQSRRQNMLGTNGKALVVGPPNPTGAHVMQPWVSDVR
jgi:hypothetical protein